MWGLKFSTFDCEGSHQATKTCPRSVYLLGVCTHVPTRNGMRVPCAMAVSTRTTNVLPGESVLLLIRWP